jgi:hypothetical protein
MNDTSAPLVYTVRANVLEYDTTWELTPDAIVRTEPRRDGPFVFRIPYTAVKDIRLSYAPSRVDSARYRCDITPKSGGAIAILSTHYAGIGDFEDRAATYAPFVRELIARVAAANPSATFRAGKNPYLYVAEHLFLIAMAALLVFVLFLVGGAGLSDLVLLKLAIIAASIPLLVIYALKNWPRSFSPDTVPLDVLPDDAVAAGAVREGG